MSSPACFISIRYIVCYCEIFSKESDSERWKELKGGYKEACEITSKTYDSLLTSLRLVTYCTIIQSKFNRAI